MAKNLFYTSQLKENVYAYHPFAPTELCTSSCRCGIIDSVMSYRSISSSHEAMSKEMTAWCFDGPDADVDSLRSPGSLISVC